MGIRRLKLVQYLIKEKKQETNESYIVNISIETT